MRKAFADNVNLALVLAGFCALEAGIARHWSGDIAAMVGGVVLIVGGSWPYVVLTVRKRNT